VKSAARLIDELERLYMSLLMTERPDLELTGTQMLALRALADGGSMRLTELARLIRVSDATASRAVDSLVAHRLVERRPDVQDRRALSLAATPAGRKRVERRRRELAVALAAALDELEPSEPARLLALLGRLNAAYSNSVSEARIA
jgi:DNA-binding MarR family transcriptional regulator